ncbi:LLM class flavin-dependent oxidoreductase [Millisia brevis]|uniref:LLM class flavin-dependent oxidoreductase n=1 Tax=Millisia brevis TaxID=264148 RepID=UPI001471BCD7|nr:LLM class flavin-dependent oxidoreductase [Millisia brevis]
MVLNLTDDAAPEAVLAELRQTAPERLVIDVDNAPGIDPFVLAAAIITAVPGIHTTLRVPTPRWHPYAIARRLAELDKLSGGRLAWTPVDVEPERAAEAARIVAGLLTSWAPDAVINDRASGVHVDTDRVRPVRFTGRHYRIDAALDAPPGPQRTVPIAAGPAVADPNVTTAEEITR